MFRSFAAPLTAAAAPPPAGAAALPGGWHPTILALLALTAAEIAVVAFLSRHLLS